MNVIQPRSKSKEYISGKLRNAEGPAVAGPSYTEERVSHKGVIIAGMQRQDFVKI